MKIYNHAGVVDNLPEGSEFKRMKIVSVTGDSQSVISMQIRRQYVQEPTVMFVVKGKTTIEDFLKDSKRKTARELVGMNFEAAFVGGKIYGIVYNKE